jgi:hypothetical protein
MTQETIHTIITVGVIAGLFSWVPLVNVVCPPGWRSAERSTEKKESKRRSQQQTLSCDAPHPAISGQAVEESSLSSQGLAERSRDLFRALSARDDREIVSSASAAMRVSRVKESSLGRKEIVKTCAE